MSIRNWGQAGMVGRALTGALLLTGLPALGQYTVYVDDDAPNDPGPGNPLVSDPLEDGSTAHPFDAIQEGIDAAQDGDTVLIADGTYTGPGNRDITFAGKAITVQSMGGLTNCVVNCQKLGRGFDFSSDEGPGSLLRGLTIMNGLAQAGGAIICYNASPTIRECGFFYNEAAGSGDPRGGGAIHCDGANCAAHISSCTFVGNTTNGTAEGAAIHLYAPVSVHLADCTFSQNTDAACVVVIPPNSVMERCILRYNDSYVAFAVVCALGGTIRDCLIVDNEADAVFVPFQVQTFENCTIANNEGWAIDLTMPSMYEQVNVRNCIIRQTWGISTTYNVDVSYSNIEGGWSGPGNIDEDPLFVDAVNNDYHLAHGSPCMDTGDPTFSPAPSESDLDHELRLWDGDGNSFLVVDMGADEHDSRHGDLNCDGAVNNQDVDHFVQALFNPDGYLADHDGDPFAWCDFLTGDFTEDGLVNNQDIDGFVAALFGN